MYFFQINLNGYNLICAAYYPDTEKFFRGFYPQGFSKHSDSGKIDIAALKKQNPGQIVFVHPEDWAEYQKIGMPPCAHTEYSILTEYFSDFLIPLNSVIIHGVALRWHDRAYLICAHSGVGKTTQARFLNELRPNEFEIICGDRPILEFRKPLEYGISESVVVHPSPWNGKENWHGGESAQLSGVILLERGDENKLSVITEQEAAIPLYSQFIHTGWSEDKIKIVANLETKLLRSVPLWKLLSNKVPDSTQLLIENIFT